MPKVPLKYVVVATCVLVATILTVTFFDRLPSVQNMGLAIDWAHIWQSIRDGQIHYGNTPNDPATPYGPVLFIPPWSALLLLPLGFLSMQGSWGLLTLLTLVALLASIPPRGRRSLLAAVLLVSAYPTMREIADGNLEVLVIGGVLILWHGFRNQNAWWSAIGMLVAASKLQETWLLLAASLWLAFAVWPREKFIRLIGIVALVAIPTLLWMGRDWIETATAINQRSSLVDMSLIATAGRLGFPGWLIAIVWVAILLANVVLILSGQKTLSRDKVALLVCASMLLAPYASAGSVVTVLAIVVASWLTRRPLLGIALIALADIWYFISFDVVVFYGSDYWTIILLLCWAIAAWFTRKADQMEAANSTPLPSPPVPLPTS